LADLETFELAWIFTRPTEAAAASQNRTAGCGHLGPTPAEVALTILWIIIIGFLAGVVARLLSPGPNNPTGFLLTTILGIVGAFIATFLGQTVGWYRADQGAGLIGAIVGAVLVLFIWNRLVAHRTISDPGVTGRRWL
jgi:uncharacterized membrane protein YeaQ/YmgE (transglycosylase-associated protein family)